MNAEVVLRFASYGLQIGGAIVGIVAKELKNRRMEAEIADKAVKMTAEVLKKTV